MQWCKRRRAAGGRRWGCQGGMWCNAAGSRVSPGFRSGPTPFRLLERLHNSWRWRRRVNFPALKNRQQGKMGRRKHNLVVNGAPLTFDGRLYPLELQEYPDGLVVRNLCDLRRGETREHRARLGESRSRPVDSAALLTSKMTHLTTLPYFSHSSLVSPSRSSSTSPRPTMFCKTHARDIGDTEETAGRYKRARCLTKYLFFIFLLQRIGRLPLKSQVRLGFSWKDAYTTHTEGIYFLFFGEHLAEVRLRADSHWELRKRQQKELHKISIKTKIMRQDAPYPILELALRRNSKTSLADFNCWWKDWTCKC